MASEAKFSVILPAASFSKSRIEEFEKEALHYNLPVTLPLQTDSGDNIIVASGLSLRDAQVLRRKVAECGYTADVVSDAAQRASELFKDGESNTQVLGEQLMQAAESVGDISSEAWDNLEMPNLDLGLSDGAEVEDWHAVSASERTQSVSLFELLQAAQSAQAVSEDNFVPDNGSFAPKMNISELNKAVSEQIAKENASHVESSSGTLNSVNRSETPTPKPMDAVNANAVSADSATSGDAADKQTPDDAADAQNADNKDDAAEAFDENATKSISSEKVDEILKSISQESVTRPITMPQPRELEASGDFPISVACMNIPTTNDEPAAGVPTPAASSVEKSQTSGLRIFVIAVIIVIILIVIVVVASIIFDIKPILELVTKPLF